MADRTKIQWTDASWNPLRCRDKTTGKVGHYCEKISSGCANCYSGAMQKRFGLPDFPGEGKPMNPNLEVFLDEKTLSQPLRWREPRMIFVCSMTDLFGSWVRDEWIDKIFAVMALAKQHTFQVLTKRPERAAKYLSLRSKSIEFWHNAARTLGWSLRFDATDFGKGVLGLCPFPLRNVWLGCSVENQSEAEDRIPCLLRCPAAIRFLSCEPLLGPVDVSDFLGDLTARKNREIVLPGIDWIIVGGESGPHARPCDLAWVRSIRDQCRAAGVPYFLKQLGSRPQDSRQNMMQWPHYRDGRISSFRDDAIFTPALKDPKGGNIEEFPEDLRIRAFPEPEAS